jgi:hypothetical protein
MPISLEDGENFGRGERVFQFPCLKKPEEVKASTNTLEIELK